MLTNKKTQSPLGLNENHGGKLAAASAAVAVFNGSKSCEFVAENFTKLADCCSFVFLFNFFLFLFSTIYSNYLIPTVTPQLRQSFLFK